MHGVGIFNINLLKVNRNRDKTRYDERKATLSSTI